MASAVLAQAPIRCSQLSITIRTSCVARADRRVSRACRPGWRTIASASQMAGATASWLVTAASSTSQTPSPGLPGSSAATCRLNLVLPHPPVPVRVTRREDATNARTSDSSRSRPMNELTCTGRFPANASSASALAARTSAAGTRPRAAATNTPRTGPARPSASANSSAVPLCGARLTPRSRSLTVRGLSLAASASSSCVSPASARSRRSTSAKPGTGSSATARPSPQSHRPQLPDPRRGRTGAKRMPTPEPSTIGPPRRLWRLLCLRTASEFTRRQCFIVNFLVRFGGISPQHE